MKTKIGMLEERLETQFQKKKVDSPTVLPFIQPRKMNSTTVPIRLQSLQVKQEDAGPLRPDIQQTKEITEPQEQVYNVDSPLPNFAAPNETERRTYSLKSSLIPNIDDLLNDPFAESNPAAKMDI